MLQSIQISNFKAITETLTLNNLASVNYLVGPNGCGKSSVLEGIIDEKAEKVFNYVQNSVTEEKINELEELNKSLDNSQDGQISFKSKLLSMKEGKGFQFEMNKPHINPGLHNSSLELFLKSSSLDENHKFISEKTMFQEYWNNEKNIVKEMFEVPDINYKLLTYNDFQFDEYKSKNDYIDVKTGTESNLDKIVKIKFEKEKPNEKSLLNFLNKYFYKNKLELKDLAIDLERKEVRAINQAFEKIYIKEFATGYQNLYTLYYEIDSRLKSTYNKYEIGSKSFIVFLIEEPENGLHPKYQQLLPEIFKDFTGKHQAKFLISTHSPFIISAAGEFDKTQRVYMIKNGVCTNPEGNSGNEVKEVVNEMLGIKNTDFLPANVVFCDQSLEVFLKLIYKNFYFDTIDLSFRVPTHPLNKEKLGGDSSLLGLVNVQDLLLQGQNVLMTNFFVIMDKVKNEERTENDFKKQENLKERYKNLLVLETFSFEEKFKQNPDDFKNTKAKVKNAKFQAEKLIEMGEVGKKEFEKLFPELNSIFGFGKDSELV